MAVRIREDGTIVCAAMHPAQEGDTYLDDHLHYRLSADLGVLVTEPMECEGGRGGHGTHGLWWWRDEVPDDVQLASFYRPPGLLARIGAGMAALFRPLTEPFLASPVGVAFSAQVLTPVASWLSRVLSRRGW